VTLQHSANSDTFEAINPYCDHEWCGIPHFNDFCCSIRLKPFKTWEALTSKPKGESPHAGALKAIYGAAPGGIEMFDLLIGGLYENKIKNFTVSEATFIIFLMMASSHLDADPFLNELYNTTPYTKSRITMDSRIFLQSTIIHLLIRSLKASLLSSPMVKAAKDNVIDSKIHFVWTDVKKKNKEFNKTVATEGKLRTS
jgi:hypothetical protein